MQFAPMAAVERWGVVLALSTLLGACGGGGAPSNFNPNPGSPGLSPTTVTVSGKITFDRIAFDAALGNGLNPNAPVESPARGVVVEALSQGGSVLATTTTSTAGDYSLTVPGSTQMTIRAKAQLLKTGTAPTWDFQVRNNTNGDALYVLDGAPFRSGTVNVTRNLRAASGWGGSSYTQTRAAAPFAILDTVYSAATLITSAQASAAFEPLNLYWSPNNRSGTTDARGNQILCIDDGDVQTSFYTSGGGNDDCDEALLAGIYVLGQFQQGSGNTGGDTDEFDQHVIAHEFGHYIEDIFARSDSIGGPHNAGDELDLRVAFGEGWGNAFGGMVLNDPVYRDSFAGADDDFDFNLEQDESDDGWYSESSVGEILWDIFDATNETGDSVAIGFGPIFAAMTGAQRTTDALTSIFSFLAAIDVVAPASTAAVNQLRNGEQIHSSDPFATGETNFGGDATVLPIYPEMTPGTPQQIVCVRTSDETSNKLGFSKFFRMTLNAPTIVSINLTGNVNPMDGTSQPAVDPDVYVYRGGVAALSGTSQDVGSEVVTSDPLAAGIYVIEVLDFDQGPTRTIAPRCMSIVVSG